MMVMVMDRIMVTITMVNSMLLVVQRLRLSSEDQDLSSLKLIPNMRVSLEQVTLVG